jgi:hypothetical protein
MQELAAKMRTSKSRTILLGESALPAGPPAPVAAPVPGERIETPPAESPVQRPGQLATPRTPEEGPVAAQPAGPWTLGADLDKYRAHAVADGSRESGESLKLALKRAGLTLEDGVNIFLLGYASERGMPFRDNDGKGLFEEPGRVPAQAGATLASFGHGLFSLADLVTLDVLPDYDKSAYRDNHPIVRPFVFAGMTIHGAWKTTEEIGNAVTWGHFDNLTGCIGLTIEDIVELAKHAGETVTNLVRLPVRGIAGRSEGAEGVMDWVLLVPLEYVSNAVEMKGISNMAEYETAFADKGVIGSALELAGSTFIIYWAVDELLDELDDDNGGRTGQPQQESPAPNVPSPEPVMSNIFESEVVIVGEPMTLGPGDILFVEP